MKRPISTATRVLLGAALLALCFGTALVRADDTAVRWDIISLQPPPPCFPAQRSTRRDGVSTGKRRIQDNRDRLRYVYTGRS